MAKKKIPSEITDKNRFTVGDQTFTGKDIGVIRNSLGLSGGHGGQLTPAIQQAIEANKQNISDIQVKNEAEANRRRLISEQKLIDQQLTTPQELQQIQQDQFNQNIPVITNTPQDQLTNEQKRIIDITNVQNNPNAPIGEKIRAVGEKAGIDITNAAKEAIPTFIKSTARIIDAAASVFSQKKQIDVIAAEGALNDAMNALNNDIELVRLGQKSDYEVQQDIQQAESFMNNLERTQQGLGKANLRYWITDGKEVEAKIILTKRDLQTFRTRLLIAEQEARVNKARMMAGLK